MYALFTAIPLVGHLNPLLRQAQELQRRGWRVAFAGFSEVHAHVAAEAPAVTFVDLGRLGGIAGSLRASMQAASRDSNFVRGTLRITRAVGAVWAPMFDGLRSAIEKDRPDIMIVDLFSSAGLAAADASGIPAIVNNPDLLASLPVTLLPPADHLPLMFTGLSATEVSVFRKKVLSPIQRKIAAHLTSFTVDRELNRLRSTRRLPRTTAHELLEKRLVLVNSAFGLEYERALPPRVEMVGPMLSGSVPGLPKELDIWLSEGPPVVYVNLGTLVEATPDQMKKMVEALDSPRFRSLWILSANQSTHLPNTNPAGMRLLQWGPQPLAVLSHPNVKAFISHCGINSAYESMVAGTPIVGIPMFADQRDMAVRIQDAGAGLWLDKTRFTAASLRRAIERVLEDPSFNRSIPAIQEAIRKSGGVQRAASLIERAAAQGQFRPA
jgi:MGT family glycosyltransferase